MIVETKVDGNPESVRAAADWLRGTYQPAVRRSAQEAQGARQLVGWDWSGEAATSYDSVAKSIVASADQEAARIGRAGELLDTLATRMQQRETSMEGIRNRAQEAGLVVTGTRIRHVSRSDIGVPANDAQAAIKDHEADLEILLQQLGDEVNEVNTDFREWVQGELTLAVDAERGRAHLGPTPGEIGSDLVKNLALNSAGAVSDKVDAAITAGSVAIDLGQGDLGVDSALSELGGVAMDAASGSTPVQILGSTAIDTGLDQMGDDGGRDPLEPSTPADSSADPEATRPRGSGPSEDTRPRGVRPEARTPASR